MAMVASLTTGASRGLLSSSGSHQAHLQLLDFIGSISWAVMLPCSITGATTSWWQRWWANCLIAMVKKG